MLWYVAMCDGIADSECRDCSEVMAEAGHGQEIVYADIDFKKNDTRRKNLPLQSQKMNDLYELKDCRNAIGFKF